MDNKLRKVVIRRANFNDDLERIAELIYKTDAFIYPYWFENIDNCISILPDFFKVPHFIFNLNNIDVAVDGDNNEILGIICSYKNDDNLDFDYTELENYNERFRFTIENYIKKLIMKLKMLIMLIYIIFVYMNLLEGLEQMDVLLVMLKKNIKNSYYVKFIQMF